MIALVSIVVVVVVNAAADDAAGAARNTIVNFNALANVPLMIDRSNERNFAGENGKRRKFAKT